MEMTLGDLEVIGQSIYSGKETITNKQISM